MKTYTEIDHLADSVLTCKAYRSHAWEKLTTYEINSEWAKRATAIWASSCTRCGRQRFVYFGRSGMPLARPYYRDPVDYPKTHRLAPVDIYKELLSRSLLVDSLVRRRNGK